MAAAIGLVTVPLVTYFISPEEYGRCGMFTLAQSIISIVVYLGMDQAFVREFHESKDIRRLLVNSMSLPICFALIISGFIAVVPRFFSVLLFDTPNEIAVVYAISLLPTFMVLQHFGLLKIRMEEKGLKYSLLTILLKVITLFLTVFFFVLYEKSFRSAVYAVIFAEIITSIIVALTALKKISFFSTKRDKKLINKMLRFGVPLIPAGLLTWLLTSADKIMLRTMCSYTELGLYTGAYKIVSILGIVQTCFTLIWTPVAYRWYESKQPNEQFSLVNDVVSFAMTLGCILILLCKELIALVLGPNFLESIYIFPFLMLYPIMYTMSETTACGIGFMRKTEYNIFLSILSGGSNIILNLILIPILGGRGAAIATGLSYIIFFWGRTLISRKLWYKFSLIWYVEYSLLVIANCLVHSFVIGPLPYFVSAVTIFILLPNAYGIRIKIKKDFVYGGA